MKNIYKHTQSVHSLSEDWGSMGTGELSISIFIILVSTNFIDVATAIIASITIAIFIIFIFFFCCYVFKKYIAVKRGGV